MKRQPGFLSAAVAVIVTVAPFSLAAQPKPAPSATVTAVEASPANGFNYPYLLRMPTDPAQAVGPYLLVEPNNTGEISDDLSFHMEAAKKLAANAIGGWLAARLQMPLLVPVFPRPKEEWRLYTHQLDRDTMLLTDGPMKRLDLQLLAMIDDARARLAAGGFATRAEVLMTGFSASGSFVNRFVMLHPDRVRAAAAGGLNALLMIPSPSVGQTVLRYPLGTADFEEVAGAPFREALWKGVPLFLYMGAEDTNDAVDFDDGYSDEEKAAVHAALGKGMKERWEKSQALYREAGANATLRTYEKVGHWTDGTVNGEILGFFLDAIAPDAPSATAIESPEELVTALYEAVSAPPGNAHDWDRFRSLFAPKAQLIVRTGQGTLRTMTVEEFIAAAGANGQAFVERELASRMERYGHIAHSWSSYEGVIGEGETAKTIRGVNSFQMAQVEGRWVVVTIFWEAEGSGGELPADLRGDSR